MWRPCCKHSLRGPVVVVEQAPEPFSTTNPSTPSGLGPACNQSVAQPLMIPLVMIVLHKRLERLAKVALTDRHHSI